jgi:hypothetical protein
MEDIDERYTDTDTLEKCVKPWELCGLGDLCMQECSNCKIPNIIRKLAYYEDLVEAGYIFRLPCKIGDYIYDVIEDTEPYKHSYIHKCKVQDISIKEVKVDGNWIKIDGIDSPPFFNREEAEKYLKGLSNA